MIGPRNRARNVLALADAIREHHALGERPVRWRELRRVLDAEGVGLKTVRRRWYVEGTDGTFVIAIPIGADAEKAVKRILHEYAHIKLHLSEQDDVVRQLMPCAKGDPREDEANLLAALLWLGADATPDHPAIARLVAKLEAPAYRQRMPRQLPLELPERIPVYNGRDAAMQFAHEDAIEEARRRRRNAIRRAGRAADRLRLKLCGNKPCACSAVFIDLEGRRWFVYDVRMDRGRRVLVRRSIDGTATHRVFVNELDERKAYKFANELQGFTAARLDRQLRDSRPAPRQSTFARGYVGNITRETR